jgi:hypothetical protein
VAAVRVSSTPPAPETTFLPCPSTARRGAQVMAALRNTAINLDRLSGQTHIARATRHYANQPADCRLLLRTA